MITLRNIWAIFKQGEKAHVEIEFLNFFERLSAMLKGSKEHYLTRMKRVIMYGKDVGCSEFSANNMIENK